MISPLEVPELACVSPGMPGSAGGSPAANAPCSRFEPAKPARRRRSQGFTLIELILVMSVLVVAVSITAPALSRFFRARTLDSEIRRVLALTRHGQSRAVAEGVPMELWIDSAQKRFGLEAEPSFEPNDPKEVSLMIEPEMQIEAVNTIGSGNAANPGSPASTKSNHPSLPRIRFLPDGSIEETSPQSIRVTGRDGSSRLVTISRTRMGYEIGGPAQ